MTKVIIDSNIVFSALRGTDSLTLRRILQSGEQYFAPNFLISKEKTITSSIRTASFELIFPLENSYLSR